MDEKSNGNFNKFFQKEWQKNGLIVFLVKYTTILYSIFYATILLLNSIGLFSKTKTKLENFTFNYLIPTLQIIFYTFTIYKFASYYKIKSDNAYIKFKTFIFYLASLSLFQTIYHFVSLFRRELRMANLQRDIEKVKAESQEGLRNEVLNIVNSYTLDSDNF